MKPLHSWFTLCTDPDAFQKVEKLTDFVKVSRTQSNKSEALQAYSESVRYEDYDEDGEFTGSLMAPKYFGACIEALAEVFFDTQGIRYNVAGYQSTDTMTEDQEDTGFDGTAFTNKAFEHKSWVATKNIKPGNPVFVQIKGVLNPKKEFMTNDGSRIMNFYGNAGGKATQLRQRYTSRFILFTNAKGLHWKLNDNTFQEIEVINGTKIRKLVDNNPFFWNEFKQRLGLTVKAPKGSWDKEVQDDLILA